MKLTNENILLASLLGSKVVEQIPRFEAVQNELAKHVLPPVHFLPLINNEEKIKDVESTDVFDLWQNDKQKSAENQFFPFSFRSSKDENWWLLPWEPMISIDGGNSIAKRNIAKAGTNQIGTIKERWSTDDYNITITGAFFGDKMRGKASQTYPRYEMERLRDYLLTPESLEVKCEPLQILNINKIVIESISFPFTKGEEVQAYEIKAISDFPWNLIWNDKKNKIPKLEVGEVIYEGVVP